jgi:mannosyltransferase
MARLLKVRDSVILFAVLLLGAALRLYGLGAKPLWYDEIGFIAHALKELSFMQQPVANYKIPFIILLKAWIGVFGIGAFAVRMLPVFFGIASVFLVYRLGKKIFDAHVALIASFLLSISCFHIYLSRQLKHYSFLVFLVLLSFIYFLDFFERKKTRMLIANLLLNILIVCTHPFGFCIIAVQFIHVICLHRVMDGREVKRWFYFQLPLVLFLGLWAWVLAAEKDYFKAILWWVRQPDLQSLAETFSTFCCGGPRYGLDALDPALFSPSIALPVMRLFGVLLILGLVRIFSQLTKGHQALVVIWLGAPIGFSFLFSRLFFPVYLIKDFLIFLPAFCLIVAKGIYHKRQIFTLPIVALISLLTIAPLMAMYKADINVDWQKAVRFIKDNDFKDDDIVIMATTKEAVSFMYYVSGADKEALKDMLIFGKFEGGRWKESFWYKDHFIITFGIEQDQGEAGDQHSGRGINTMHSLDYITNDFDRKVLQREDVIRSNRQLWLLVSRWEDDANHSAEPLRDKLQTYVKLTLSEKVGGIKIYRFSPATGKN